MLKYNTIALLIVSLAFSYGVRPAFDLGANWSNLKLSSEGYSQTTDYIAIRLATSVPYSKVVGLYAEVAAITWMEEGTSTNFGGGGFSGFMSLGGISSKLGLIQVVPSKSVSPFFKEYFTIDRLSFSYYDETFTFLSFGLNAGIEFMSSSHISPIIEGQLTIGSQGSSGGGYDSSSSLFSYGFGLGLRYSWVK